MWSPPDLDVDGLPRGNSEADDDWYRWTIANTLERMMSESNEIPRTPTPAELRDWIDKQQEGPSAKKIALEAIEAFEWALLSRERLPNSLEILYSAATHPNLSVVEIGKDLLFQLAVNHTDGREKLWQMSREKNFEIRIRSMDHLCDRFPRQFCSDLLSSHLSDRNAIVRGAALHHVEQLHLHELAPRIEQAVSIEPVDGLKLSMEVTLQLFRNMHFMDERRRTLHLYFPERYPARMLRCFDPQLKQLENQSLESVRREFGKKYINESLRRPWAWPRSSD